MPEETFNAVIGSDVDGGVYVDAQGAPEGEHIVFVTPRLFIDNNLFDEARPGFTWQGDAEFVADVVYGLLKVLGYEFSMTKLSTAVIECVTPGGPVFDPAKFVVELTKLRPDVYVTHIVWDRHDPLDWTSVNHAMDLGAKFFTEIDSGSDSEAVIATTEEITTKQAQALWDSEVNAP